MLMFYIEGTRNRTGRGMFLGSRLGTLRGSRQLFADLRRGSFISGII